MKKITYSFLLIFYVIVGYARVDFRGKDDVFVDYPDVQLLLDLTGEMSVQSIKHQTFTYNPTHHNIGEDNDFWLKIEAVADEEESWFGEMYNQRLKTLELYACDSIGEYQLVSKFDRNKKEERYVHRFPMLEFPMKKGKNTFYIKYSSTSYLGVNMSIQQPEIFYNQSVYLHFLYGGFFCTLLALIVYNLFFYFSIRDNTYLLYIAYVLMAGLDVSRTDLLFYNYVWQPGFMFTELINEFSRGMLFVFLIQYAVKFVKKEGEESLLFTLGRYYSVWLVCYCFIKHQFPTFLNFDRGYSDVVSLIIIGAIYYKAFLLPKSVSKFYFLIGFGAVFFGWGLYTLFVLGVVSGSHLVYHVMYYVMIVDAIMFSLALSSKIRQEKDARLKALEKEATIREDLLVQRKENEYLLEKVNRELEEKVTQRTSELKQKSDEVYAMSVELDKHNYKLKRDLKEEETKRALSTKMTKDEFFQIFKSKLTCLKFLADKKWNDGYVCVKCGHHTGALVKTSQGKKCNKCKHIESATANTIFHGVRFDLPKAFYLVYVMCNYEKDYSTKELAMELDLNSKTCFKFKEKILVKKAEVEREGVSLKSWEELV